MKRAVLFIFISVFTSFAICSAQSRAEKKAAEQAMIASVVKSSVDNKKLSFIIDRIIPASSPSRSTLDGYFLNISNDTINCYLPYIGNLRSAVFNPGTLSIIFENQKIQLTQETDKKGNYRLVFEVKSQQNLELFSFNIKLFLSGNAIISVNPSGREYITYNGNIKY